MKLINDIPGIKTEDFRKLKRVFDRRAQIDEVVLYGSRAKGSHRPGSDIDLTLRGDGLTLATLMGLSAEIDDLLLPYQVDLSIFSHIDNQGLREHIQRVGKVVLKNE